MDVFDLVAKITLDSSEYNTGLNNAEESANSFGSRLGSGLKKAGSIAAAGIGVVAGATAFATKKFFDGINATAEYGDNVDKMSQKIGISAESYQKWDYVMQRAGTSVDNLKMGMKTLSKQAEANSDSFQKLGISQEEVKNLSQEELFEKTIKGLADMEAGTERTTLATELLGRAGADLGPLLNEGSDAIEEQMEIAEKYGMVMSDEAVKASADFEDSLTTLNMTFTGLKNRMMAEFLPSLTQVTEGLAAIFAGDTDEGVQKVTEGIDEFIGKFTETIPKVFDIGAQIIPSIITSIMNSLPQLVLAASNAMMTLINGLLQNLPMILNAGFQVIVMLANGISQSLPTLIPTIVNTITSIVSMLIDNIPMLITAGLQLIQGLGQGLINALPVLITGITQILTELINMIMNDLPMFLNMGIQMIIQLMNGLFNALPQIIDAIIQLVTTLLSTIMQNLPQFLEMGINLILQLMGGLFNALPQILDAIVQIITALINMITENLPMFLEMGINLIIQLMTGLSNALPEILNAMLSILLELIQLILKNLPMFIEKGIELVVKLAKGLIKAIPKIVKAMGQVLSDVVKALKDIDWLELGKDIIKGIADGVKNAASAIKDAVVGAAKDAFDGIKKFFKIGSPSKLMRDEIGKWIPKGIAVGIEENIDDVNDAFDDIDEMLSFDSGIESTITTTVTDAQPKSEGQTVNYGDIVVNVYGTEGQDVKRLADEVISRLERQVNSRRLAFG